MYVCYIYQTRIVNGLLDTVSNSKKNHPLQNADRDNLPDNNINIKWDRVCVYNCCWVVVVMVPPQIASNKRYNVA